MMQGTMIWMSGAATVAVCLLMVPFALAAEPATVADDDAAVDAHDVGKTDDANGTVTFTSSRATSETEAKRRNGSAERVGEVMADLVIYRPIGVARTVAGAALLVIASPFVAVGGEWSITKDVLVGEPARYAFARPLGKP